MRTANQVVVVCGAPALGEMWRVLLEGDGYEVTSVADPLELAQLGGASAPRLVVVDTEGVAGADGSLEAIAYARSVFRNVRILALVGPDVDRDKALRAGATLCLSVSVDVDELLGFIAGMLCTGADSCGHCSARASRPHTARPPSHSQLPI